MVARELPLDEWDRLIPLPIGEALQAFPAGTRIIVVEDDSQEIVGTWAVIPYVHVEGVWIDESSRNAGHVARRLIRATFETARAMGATSVLTGSLTADVTALIARLGGVELPGRHFVMPVEDKCR